MKKLGGLQGVYKAFRNGFIIFDLIFSQAFLIGCRELHILSIYGFGFLFQSPSEIGTIVLRKLALMTMMYAYLSLG